VRKRECWSVLSPVFSSSAPAVVRAGRNEDRERRFHDERLVLHLHFDDNIPSLFRSCELDLGVILVNVQRGMGGLNDLAQVRAISNPSLPAPPLLPLST
jgi:hypothetical protein